MRMKTFALRLKKERQRGELTQEQMAKELGIPLGTYQKYESLSVKGHYEPSQETLVKIAEILKTSIDYLLGLK